MSSDPKPARLFLRALFIAYAAAHFLYFAFDGLRVHWADDDPMNLFTYWRAGFWRVLRSNLTFFDGFYRPLAGLFYLPIYWLAGLDPLPYRAVIIGLLAVNAVLLYRVARRLGASELAAGLAALFLCVHGEMIDLIYQTAAIYDILCFTFFFAALDAYLRRRSQALPLRPRDCALVAALLIAALNAKEMAVVFPALLLAYEWITHPRQQRQIWPAAAAAAIAAASLCGKFFARDALAAADSYKPELSLFRWMDANVSYTNAIFCRIDTLSWIAAPLLWLALLVVAWATRRAALKFAWVYIMLITAPISFIPRRGGSCLYLPLAGWALFAGVLGADLAGLFARLPWPRRLPRWIPHAVLAAALMAAHTRWTAAHFAGAGSAYRGVQARLWSAISEMNRVGFHPPHGKKVLILNAPLPGYDMYFVANLWFNDKTLEVRNEPDAARADPSCCDYTFRFEGGRLSPVQR